jgi:FtsP/CotA-like multicopper oxidase with cupredoxin domain
MMACDWGINGRRHNSNHFGARPCREHGRLELSDTTAMWYPVHLHGHTFAFDQTGVRTDTVIVLPGQTASVVFDADNPCRWMLDCHDLYDAGPA